jgi:hypothetical protein
MIYGALPLTKRDEKRVANKVSKAMKTGKYTVIYGVFNKQ